MHFTPQIEVKGGLRREGKSCPTTFNTKYTGKMAEKMVDIGKENSDF